MLKTSLLVATKKGTKADASTLATRDHITRKIVRPYSMLSHANLQKLEGFAIWSAAILVAQLMNEIWKHS